MDVVVIQEGKYCLGCGLNDEFRKKIKSVQCEI